jgi:hypothetical protein
MKRIELTYSLATSCAKDEANRNMRKNGRSAWNEEDHDLAVITLHRLWWNNIHPDIRLAMYPDGKP